MKSKSRLLLGFFWIVIMLLALFYTFSFSSDVNRVRVLVLYVLAVLLTLRTRYWITYIWFAIITTLCVIYWVFIYIM